MTSEQVQPISDERLAEIERLAALAAGDWDQPQEWGSLPLRQYGEALDPDTLATLVARMRAAEAKVERTRALATHSNHACTFPDDDCICAVPIFDLRVALANKEAS